jgi:hypothetical protein
MTTVLMPPACATRKGRNRERYIEALQSPAVLLVVVDEQTEVIAGLSEATAAPGTRVQASRDSLGFATSSLVLADTLSAPRDMPPKAISGSALARLLVQRSHFIVPLRRKSIANQAFSDQISIGRARNMDIVLRHQSVSKFHAWFEMDDDHTFYVGDAGSTYATTINGRPLDEPDGVALRSGDVLTFGEIEALFCEAGVLWDALPG